MTITSTIPASGTIIAPGATLTLVNTIGENVTSITLNRSGTGGSNEVIWTSGGGYESPYTGSRVVSGAEATFTFRRNAGWDSSPFQLDVDLPAGLEQLTFILVAEGEYPEDMQPFNDPVEGSGSGDQTVAALAIVDNVVVRGDGGDRGVQGSGVTLDDSDNLTGVGQINADEVDLTSELTLRNSAEPSFVSNNRVKVWADENESPSRILWKDDSNDVHTIVDWSIAGTEQVDASRYIAGSGGSNIEVVDGVTTLTTGVTKFTYTGAGVSLSEPVDDEITVTIDGAAVPAANLSPIIETGTGTPNNDATVPAANPIILRDGAASLTPLSVIRTGSEAGQDDPAIKITTPAGGSHLVLENSSLSREILISDVGITGNGKGINVNIGTDATGAPGALGLYGAFTTTASTKGGGVIINAGNASGSTSDGGDVEIGGGSNTGGNDGDIRIGYPQANEIDLAKGVTIQETADHPVSPVAGAGQLWPRSSDGKLIWTIGSTGVDYDLTEGVTATTNSVFARYDAAEGSGTPASGQALFSGSTFGATTTIKIDRYDNDDSRIKQTWGRLTTGDTLFICGAADRSIGANYTLDSDPTLNINAYTFTVTSNEAAGSIPSEVEIWPVATNDAATTFIGLTDVDEPDYTGHAGQYVRVNSTPDGLEFATPSGAGDVVGPVTSVVDNIATYNNTTGDLIKDSGIAIGAIAAAQTTANDALPKAGGIMTGNITMAGTETVDGRDISADGTQLDTNTTELADLGLTDEGGASFGLGVWELLDTALGDCAISEFSVNNANPFNVTAIRVRGQGKYNTGPGEVVSSFQIGDWVTFHAATSTAIGGEPATAVYRIDSAASTPSTDNHQYTVVRLNTNGSVWETTSNYSIGLIRRVPDLDGLTDTSINTVASGDILKWDGSDWVNISGTAVNIAYDNATSGLTATDAQAAIDEVDGDLDTHIANVANPHNTTLNNIGPGTHSQLEAASVDSGTIFSSLQNGQIVDGGAFTQKTAIATNDKFIIEETGGQKRWGIISDIPGFGQEANDLATDGINGIVDNQLAVGTGAGTAEYQTLSAGAVAFSGTTFSQAGRADLSDASTVGAISSGAGAPGTTPSKVGDSYIDTTNDIAYVATGTASSADWTDVSSASGSGINTGTEAARPASPPDGTFYYATDTQAFSYYDTSAWENVGILPDDVTVEIDGVSGKLQIKALGVDTAQLADDGVTYAKMQNVVANNVLLGNNVGAGAIVDELTPAEIRTMINVEEGATAGGGVTPFTGAGAPSSTPGSEGDIYVDTTGDVAYIATGIVSSADWTDVSQVADNAITLAKIANGTDGELITWSAAGVATTVPAGTDTHVLTSNGPDTVPTFQAAPSAPTLYMRFTIEDPVAGDNFIDLGVVDVACTVTKVYHYFRGAGTSIQWQMAHGTNPTSGANLFSSSITTNTKTSIGSTSTGFNDATLAAGETMWLDAGTLTGAVDLLHLTVVYTED